MSLLLDFCERERKIRRDRLEVSDFNRELIDAFANRILHLKGDGEIVDFRGTFEEYRQSLGQD